jgi:PTH1 family peptidyl-tRNA hydrolase
MKLIIGLGNPGQEYTNTRHNAGFMFLDVLQKKYSLQSFTFNKKFNAEISEGFTDTQEKIILAKPQTFMNCSGRSVQSLIVFYKISPQDIIVVADDLDIEIGKYKISKDTRAAGHNGIQNIIDTIGTQDFTRIRIGVEKVGGRKERGTVLGDKFVLQNFTKDELDIITKTFDSLQNKI